MSWPYDEPCFVCGRAVTTAYEFTASMDGTFCTHDGARTESAYDALSRLPLPPTRGANK